MVDKSIYPTALQKAFDEGKAVPLDVEGLPLARCLCGGHEVIYYFQIDGRPSDQPRGKKSKWLDLGPRGRGWFPGTIEAMDCPACAAGATIQWLAGRCGLEGPDLEVRLDTFRTNGPLSGKAEGLKTAIGILAQNEAMAGFVTFWGPFGSGKSHLMKGVVNGARVAGHYAYYTLASDLLASIREKFGDDKGTINAAQMLEGYRHIRVLAIDEIDKLNPTPWALETINRLIDFRYRMTESCVTILGTNLDPLQFPPGLGYLASRMRGGACVQVPGPDMRPALAPRLV